MEDYKVTLPAELITLVNAYGRASWLSGKEDEIYGGTDNSPARTELLKGIARAVRDARLPRVTVFDPVVQDFIHGASAPRTGQ